MAFSGIDFEILMGIFLVATVFVALGEVTGHSFIDRFKRKYIVTNEQGVIEVYPDPTTPSTYTIDGMLYALDHAHIVNRKGEDFSAKLFLYSPTGTPRTETVNKDEIGYYTEDPIRLFGAAIKDFKIVKGGLQNALKNENDALKTQVQNAETLISNMVEDLRQGHLSVQEQLKKWEQERGTYTRSYNRKGSYPEMPTQPSTTQPQQQQQSGGTGYGV